MTSYVSTALRRLVIARALDCCEYCRIHSDDVFWGHQVDPIFAEKHGGETLDMNLCCSCVMCNRYKGTDLCSLDLRSGDVVALFHPRRQQWTDHFALDEALTQPLTPIGWVTVKVLRLNENERIQERAILVSKGRYPRDMPQYVPTLSLSAYPWRSLRLYG